MECAKAVIFATTQKASDAIRCAVLATALLIGTAAHPGERQAVAE